MISHKMKIKKKKTSTYIFHRGNTWYSIELYGDEDAIKNALYNKGTTKVTNLFGKVIWLAS